MERSDLPLAGIRVLITRPRHQARALRDRLRHLGAQPILYPTVDIAPPSDLKPLDRAIRQWTHYDWVVFTSTNGVRAVWNRARRLGVSLPIGPRVAAVGPATAAALRRRGRRADFIPAIHLTDEIPAGLGRVAGLWILLPRAEGARRALVDDLRHRGARLEEVLVYRTGLPARPSESLAAVLRAHQVQVVTFTSPSTVRNFIALLGEDGNGLLHHLQIACIGPITAQAAAAAGMRAQWVASVHTTAGLVDALVEGYRHAND